MPTIDITNGRGCSKEVHGALLMKKTKKGSMFHSFSNTYRFTRSTLLTR